MNYHFFVILLFCSTALTSDRELGPYHHIILDELLHKAEAIGDIESEQFLTDCRDCCPLGKQKYPNDISFRLRRSMIMSLKQDLIDYAKEPHQDDTALFIQRYRLYGE